jgi:hypothetical protein
MVAHSRCAVGRWKRRAGFRRSPQTQEENKKKNGGRGIRSSRPLKTRKLLNLQLAQLAQFAKSDEFGNFDAQTGHS